MSRSFEEMPTLQNVMPGGRATLHCPLGLSYDQITFKLQNCTPSDLENFKVITGSKAQWDLTSGQVVADINKYYDRHEKEGFLTLWFYRPEMKTEEERAFTSLGTIDIPSLTVQFDIKSGVETPAITAYALRRRAANLGMFTKMREYPLNFATAGLADIDNIPRGARVTAFHLMKADVSRVELRINNGSGSGSVIDWPKDLLELAQEQYGRKPLSAKATHLDMNLIGKTMASMPTANLVDMRIKPYLDTPGSMTVLVEYIDQYHGI